MKPFTIRKAAQPGKGTPPQDDPNVENQDYGSGAEDGQLDQASQDQSPYGDIPNLTQEEMTALQPKKTKVVNPWIHGQTHHEYLDKIIVSASSFRRASSTSSQRSTRLGLTVAK
jgi:hypothetical protein